MPASRPYPGLDADYVPGVEVQFGPYVLFIPPMRLRDFKLTHREKLLDKVNALRLHDPSQPVPVELFEESVNSSVTILQRALSRNYPNITTDDIEEYLDNGNCRDLMDAVLDVNLSRAVRPSWVAAETTATPATQTMPTTSPSMTISGTNSNSPSPQPSVGP